MFYAIVVERHERELEVDPIDRRVTYRRVKAREVLGIWRKSRAQNGRVVEALRAVDDCANGTRRAPPQSSSSCTSRTRSTHARRAHGDAYQSPPQPREER